MNVERIHIGASFSLREFARGKGGPLVNQYGEEIGDYVSMVEGSTVGDVGGILRFNDHDARIEIVRPEGPVTRIAQIDGDILTIQHDFMGMSIQVMSIGGKVMEVCLFTKLGTNLRKLRPISHFVRYHPSGRLESYEMDGNEAVSVMDTRITLGLLSLERRYTNKWDLDLIANDVETKGYPRTVVERDEYDGIDLWLVDGSGQAIWTRVDMNSKFPEAAEIDWILTAKPGVLRKWVGNIDAMVPVSGFFNKS